MNLIDDLVNKVQVLNTEKDYWFVRTSSGLFFETFYNEDFIGIGWNEITYDDLKNKPDHEVKSKIAKLYKFDLTNKKGKRKTSGVYNKLISFLNLKKGDLIIIPSVGSSRLAFGEIEEDNIYIENNSTSICQYRKRRKIKWLTVENTNSLNPIFYQIKKSRHSISSVNKYQSYIDSVTNNFFYKGDKTHLVVDIKTQKDINVIPLSDLLKEIHQLALSINNQLDLEEDINNASIKLNLQSPGKIEFIYPKGKALVLAITLLSIYNCTDPSKHPKNKDEVNTLYEQNVNELKSLDEKLVYLEAEDLSKY